MFSATINLYRNAYNGLTRRIWLLSIVMLINRSGTMVLAFLTLYSRHLGFSIEQGGWVVAIYGVGSVTGALIGGKLSDRFGFYYIQFAALFIGGLLFYVLGQMNNYFYICVSTFILAMVNESFRPANATAIAHYSTPENRTQSFSLVRLAINIGFGIGIALGGFLASVNYHLLFWVDGSTNILAALMLLLILPRVSLSQQHKAPLKQELLAPRLSAYRDKVFLKFLFYQLLFAICFFQLFTTIPLYFKLGLHLDEFTIGSVMAVNGLVIALFEMVLVFKLEGRKPYLLLISYGSLMMGLAFLFLNLPFLRGIVIALIAMFTITMAEMLSMPFMNSYYINRSSNVTRGQYAGLYTVTWSTAQVIGSSTGGVFAERFGFRVLWFVIFGISVLAAGGFFLMERNATLPAGESVGR